MNYLETALREEIEDEIRKLGDMDVGTDEYKTTVDGITKLTAQLNEMEKIHAEAADKKDARFHENTLKAQQLAEEQRDRRIKNGIAIGGIILPVVVTIWGTLKTLEFEKEGTVTTIMGRGFINKLLPKK